MAVGGHEPGLTVDELVVDGQVWLSVEHAQQESCDGHPGLYRVVGELTS